MVSDFLADWHEHGTNVLEKVRQTEPATYLRVAAVLVPKEMNVAVEQRSGPMDGEEIRQVRRLVEVIRAAAPTDADKDTVFGIIEEALRSHYAKTVASD